MSLGICLRLSAGQGEAHAAVALQQGVGSPQEPDGPTSQAACCQGGEAPGETSHGPAAAAWLGRAKLTVTPQATCASLHLRSKGHCWGMTAASAPPGIVEDAVTHLTAEGPFLQRMPVPVEATEVNRQQSTHNCCCTSQQLCLSVQESDEEQEMGEALPAPRAVVPRRRAAAAKQTYVEVLSSDEDEQGSEEESDFEITD